MQEFLDLEICPICGGNGILEEEAGGLYIMCLECGCHSVPLWKRIFPGAFLCEKNCEKYVNFHAKYVFLNKKMLKFSTFDT